MIDIKIDIARTPRNAIQRVGDIAEHIEEKNNSEESEDLKDPGDCPGKY